jgi:hypothetical protein
MVTTFGQTSSEVATGHSPGAVALSGQEFHCHTGYPLAQCQQDILQLKNILIRYRVEGLGPWTWVLVRSEDWGPISQTLRLNPDSPAFTALDQRETFLEEAIFLHDPLRIAQLMKEWQLPMTKLLDLAVTHELGHALCDEQNEAAADRFGEELRLGMQPACQVAKRTKQKGRVSDREGLRAGASAGR